MVALPAAVADAIGAPAADFRKNEVLTTSVGSVRLTLRRDCHGKLRLIELSFDPSDAPRVRACLRSYGTSRVVIEGVLEVFEIVGLGRILSTPTRVELTLRMTAPREKIASFLNELMIP